MKPRMFAVATAILIVLSGVAAGYSHGFGPVPPQEPAGTATIDDMLAFTEQLTALAKDETLTENERALRVTELATRQQVAQLGLEWIDDVQIPDHALPGDAIRALSEHLGGVIGPEQEAALDGMDALPEPVRDALAKTVNAFHALDLAAKNVHTEADLEHLETLAKQHGDELPEEAWLEQVGAGIAGIFSARLALVEAAFELKEALEEEGEGLEVPSLMVPMGHDSDLLEVHEEIEEDLPVVGSVTICINSHNETNVYNEDCNLLIDTSDADKKYYNNAGGHHTTGLENSGASALIDFFGNNDYGNSDGPPAGQGQNGGAYSADGRGATAVGMLMSLGTGSSNFTAGDQGANGGSLSVGSTSDAPIALGFLLSGGDNVFESGDQGANGGAYVFGGAAPVAVGLLIDVHGNDLYVANGDGGRGVNGGANADGGFCLVVCSAITSGLLLDLEGTDYYQDGSIPKPGEVGYICMTDNSGDCGFEEDEDWNSCVDCSVIPKGSGAQIDVGVPENVDPEFLEDVLEEELPGRLPIDKHDCDDGVCKRFWFRAAEVEDVNAVEEGRLLSDPPEGVIPSIRSGSNTSETETIKINFTSSELGEDLVLGEGPIMARFTLAAWSAFSNDTGIGANELRASFRVVHEEFEGCVWKNDLQRIGGVDVDNVIGPHERIVELFPHGACKSEVPSDAGIQFSFWLQSGGLLEQRPGFSIFYDSVHYASHIDLPLVAPFEPDGVAIQVENGGGSFRAGEVVELVAWGTNTTDDEERVAVDWSVDPDGLVDEDEVPEGRSDTFGFRPVQSGPGTITATWNETITATLLVTVDPGPLDEIAIQNEDAENLTSIDLVSGSTFTLFAAGFDEFGNPVEETLDCDWEYPEGFLEPVEEEDASFMFEAVRVDQGEIKVTCTDKDGVEATASVDVEIEPGELDRIEIQVESGGERIDADGHEVAAGQNETFYAMGFDGHDNLIGEFPQAQWGHNPPALGAFNVTMGPSVNFTAKQGEGTITAVVGEVEGTATIQVLPGEPVWLGGVQPELWTVNEAGILLVHLEDAFGNPVSDQGGEDLDVTLMLDDVPGPEDGLSDGTMQAPMTDGEVAFDDLVYCCTAGEIVFRAQATDASGVTVFEGTIPVEVGPGTLDHLEIVTKSGSQATFEAGGSLEMIAVGYDEFGNLREGEEVEVQWHVEPDQEWGDDDWDRDPAQATTVSSQLLLQSDRTGTAMVTAIYPDSSSGVDDGLVQVTVLPNELEVIRIEVEDDDGNRVPAEGSLEGIHGGQSVWLFAAGYDEFHNYVGDVPVGWEVDPSEDEEKRGTLNAYQGAPSVRFTAGLIGTGYLNTTGPVTIENPSLNVNVDRPGPSTELVILTESVEVTAGETWPEIQVRVEDGHGNHVADDNTTRVRLGLGDGFSGTLDGTRVAQAAQGIAIFDTISYTVADRIWIVAEAIDENGAIDPTIQEAANGFYHIEPADMETIRIQKDTNNAGEQVTALDLQAGQDMKLYAAGYDSYGNYAGDVVVNWTTEPSGLGGFAPEQAAGTTFTAQQATQGFIFVSNPDDPQQNVLDAIPVTVTPGPLDHFKIRDAPDGNGEHKESLRLPTGNTTRLYAAGYDAFGNYLTDVQVDWRLDPPRLGTLEPTAQTKNATFTAKQGGTGRIVADHTNLPGDVTVNLQVDADIMPPQAIIAASCTELTCTLDASGSKPGTATIASYTWDLGDGNTQQGKKLEHTYAEPGQYTLTLNVSDGNGLSHETQHTVTVTLPPEPMITLEVTTRPQDPAPGEAVTATARIENVGNVALLQFSVAFTLDDEPLREQSYPRLEAGENMTIRATWNAHEGNQTLIVEIPGHATQSQKIQVATTDALPDGAPPRITAQEAPAAPLIIVLLVVFAVPWILKRRQPPREAASVSSQDPTQSMARNRGHGRPRARKPITVLCIVLLASLALAGCVDGLDLEPGTPEEPRFTISLEAQPTQGGVQVRWNATPLEGSSLARVEVQAVKPPAPGDDSEPIRHGWNQTNPPAAGSHVIALPPGQWHLAARAEDDTGREAWSQDRIVTLSQPRFTGQDAQSAGQAEPLRINAGQDKVIHDAQGKGEASFTLNGETRPGPGQRVLGHEWRYDDGAGVRQAVLATFTRPIGEYVFTFHVEYEDAQGIKGVAEDTVRVQVLPNRAPVADAGPSREARDAGGSGGVEVVLDGSGSFDPDGRIVSYSWESDGSVVLSQREGVVRFPVGTHSVTLTVRDNAGATGQDTTRVIVHPGHHPVARGVASDGIDLDGDGTGAVELDGSSSFHPDGTITRYVWNDAGGNVVAEQAIVTLTVDVGTHEFTLVVEDEAGRTGTDNVMVTVLPQPDPPQAHFQANCSGLTCTFDASGSTGYQPTYEWSFGDGSQATGETVTHTYTEIAIYPVTLVVRDAAGRTANVQEPVNLRPDHPLRISSPAFGAGDEIPGQYGCQLAVNGYPSFLLGVHPLSVELGNSPPLVLVAPQDAQTLAFTILDMTEGVNGQPMRNVHWLSYDIEVPPEGIVEISQGTPGSGTQGMNHKGMSGFTEFCSLLLPALTDSSNTYEFRVYALDSALGLEAGADLEQFEEAIDGHVLATDSFDAFYSDKVCLELVTVEGVSPDDCVMF